MTINSENLSQWAINRIKREFKDDVCLLLGHNTLKLDEDMDDAAPGFFIPVSENAIGLAKTFIVDGIGYDLFPVLWERLERTADLDEYNTTCLADATVLYYRNEEDKARFIELQARLLNNLHNPDYMVKKALEKLGVAMEIFQTMMFEDTLYKVRKASGYIVDYLSIAVANANQQYFKNGQTNQVLDLLAMKGIPRDFIRLYEDIVKADSSEELKKLCHEMISNTRQFLITKKRKGENGRRNQNFKDLANWYHELSYTWRRVYHWCDKTDPIRGFMWGCMLQSELDIVREEFGLGEMDLLGTFNANDMIAYRRQAETLEKQIVSAIKDHGATLDVYDSIDEFIKNNP
jgi:hypothetical protein